MPLDDVLDPLAAAAALAPRDEALARAIATVTFRRLGTIRAALAARLDRGLPKDQRLLSLLAAGAAQILFLDVPDHAAVDTAVGLARGDPRLRHAAGTANAVLRRLARERDMVLAVEDPFGDTPGWLKERWTAHYGEEKAAAIAQAHRAGAAVDLTVKTGAAEWASRLGATLLPTGSVRLSERTPVPDLEGFGEGAWWVQDAAASLPARLLLPREGENIADLCAAPGGKTAQLAAAGARVLAVDRSQKRLERLARNLERLKLSCADARGRRHLARRGAFRCHPPRRALLGHGHLAPAPGNRLDQERGGRLQSSPTCSGASSTGRRGSSARAAGSSIAPARSNRRKAKARPRLFFPAMRISSAIASSLPRSADWARRSPAPAICARCPVICLRRRAAAAGSTVSLPPGS